MTVGEQRQEAARARREARQNRLHRYQWALRQFLGGKRKERFGLDTLVDGKPDPAVVRAMARARKQERRAAR